MQISVLTNGAILSLRLTEKRKDAPKREDDRNKEHH